MSGAQHETHGSFLASGETARWIEGWVRARLAKASRLAQTASVERIRQLNRGASVVLQSCLSLIERTKTSGEPLNLQRLTIHAENVADRPGRSCFAMGRRSAARKVRKIVVWCLAAFKPQKASPQVCEVGNA